VAARHRDRARIYVFLRDNPNSTSDEVAGTTGLYPSTVREALAELHDEGTVDRDKREASGAGNNPYEYEAIAPSELVQGVVGDVQRELNAVFNLDRRLGGESPTATTRSRSKSRSTAMTKTRREAMRPTKPTTARKTAPRATARPPPVRSRFKTF